MAGEALGGGLGEGFEKPKVVGCRDHRDVPHGGREHGQLGLRVDPGSAGHGSRRHTFATRLSAEGVADYFVTQMLRQSDASVFTCYSQTKLHMMREALSKLDRHTNERGANSFTALAS